MSEIKQYRKKPVIIEAMQFNKAEDYYDIREWSNRTMNETDTYTFYIDIHAIGINTLEGRAVALLGDYIVRGVKGEFYPCKPDIFEQIYEEVAE